MPTTNIQYYLAIYLLIYVDSDVKEPMCKKFIISSRDHQSTKNEYSPETVENKGQLC